MPTQLMGYVGRTARGERVKEVRQPGVLVNNIIIMTEHVYDYYGEGPGN